MIEKMELFTAPTISRFPLPLHPHRFSPTIIRFQPLLPRTTYFPSLHNQTVFSLGLQFHRDSSLRSTASEEISTDTTVCIEDEPNTVDDTQPVQNREDYESQLNKELQEGSLFDNPLKLFKFLQDLNIKLRQMGGVFKRPFVDLVAMMSIFSSESSKMLGEYSTVLSILSGYLSNFMTVLFILDYEEMYSFLAFGSGGAIALWIIAAIIGAIDSIPVLPKALELIGLGYTLWFSSRYLILKKNREELFGRVEQLKQQVLGSNDD